MDSMPYQIRYSAMETVLSETNERFADWTKSLGKIRSAAEEIVKMKSFSGRTAQSVKDYLSEVYEIIEFGISQALADFQSKFLLYKNNYYEIESNIYAVMTASTMKWYHDQANKCLSNQQSLNESVNRVLYRIGDIVYVPPVNSWTLESDLQDMGGKCESLGNAIRDYEASAVSGDLSRLKSLIASVKEVVKSYYDSSHLIGEYKSGDFFTNRSVLYMAGNVADSIAYAEKNEDKILKAVDRQDAVYAKMEADYEAAVEAAAKTRADTGGAKLIVGAAATAVGIFCIASCAVLTGGIGMAVLAGAGAVVGTGATIFGAAETFEGTQEVVHGLRGDGRTVSFNPIRDTMFASNPEMYYGVGRASVTFAALFIPVNVAIKGVEKGATAGMLWKTGAKTVVKEVVMDQAVGITAGKAVEGVEKAAKRLWNVDMGETTKTLLNIAVSAAVQKGLDYGLNTIEENVHALKLEREGVVPKGTHEKLSKWQYKVDIDTYAKHRKVFDNPKYYDQETGAAIWPKNNGAIPETVEIVTLEKGTIVDRIGYDDGSFMGEDGTPYGKRSLEPGSEQKPYARYEVLKPIEDVEKGVTAPWFDQPGGGTQLHMPKSIAELVELGYLKKIVDDVPAYSNVKIYQPVVPEIKSKDEED